jgi:hypothetical protein
MDQLQGPEQMSILLEALFSEARSEEMVRLVLEALMA